MARRLFRVSRYLELAAAKWLWATILSEAITVKLARDEKRIAGPVIISRDSKRL
jgi:hypothetical protein